MTPVLKKHRNKNRYVSTPEGLWVRDFAGPAPAVDINSLATEADRMLFAGNELENRKFRLPAIDSEQVYAPDCVVVSDGCKFPALLETLKGLPRGVVVIGVNRTLARWDPAARMDYFLMNNPGPAALSCLPPGRYVPRAVCSVRTHPEFVRQYVQRGGFVYRYVPTPDEHYRGPTPAPAYHLDDYRNPVCAAVGLAHRFGVRRLALVGCDDVFEGARPGAVALPSGYHLYPAQRMAHGLVDASLYWLRSRPGAEARVGYCSFGPEYENASYISPENLAEFFH